MKKDNILYLRQMFSKEVNKIQKNAVTVVFIDKLLLKAKKSVLQLVLLMMQELREKIVQDA